MYIWLMLSGWNMCWYLLISVESQLQLEHSITSETREEFGLLGYEMWCCLKYCWGIILSVVNVLRVVPFYSDFFTRLWMYLHEYIAVWMFVGLRLLWGWFPPPVLVNMWKVYWLSGRSLCALTNSLCGASAYWHDLFMLFIRHDTMPSWCPACTNSRQLCISDYHRLSGGKMMNRWR